VELCKDMQRVLPLKRPPGSVKLRWNKGQPWSGDMKVKEGNIRATLRLLQWRGPIDKIIVEMEEKKEKKEVE